MFNFFRKKSQGTPVDTLSRLTGEPVFEVHRKYWTPNENEKSMLSSRGLDSLSATEKLRLLHLKCMDQYTKEQSKEINEDSFDSEGCSDSEVIELVNLLLKSQAFGAKKGFVWMGEAGQSEQREPDIQGDFRDASYTHLGCIEAINVDPQGNPSRLEFIPLDDIRGMVFAPPSLYRAARIFFDSEREDTTVYVPSIYGISWLSPHSTDHDGTMTRFSSYIDTEGESVGMGFGQVDFSIAGKDGGASIFGLSRVGEIMIGLEMSDPRFEQKCKARGLDPDQVRKQFTA